MPLARRRSRSVLITLAAAITLATQGCASAQQTLPWQDGRSLGVEARDEVTTADLGMPIYPGAVTRHDKPDETGSLTLAIWGGSKGLKVSAAKFLSADPSERVAAFYLEALGRFGTVLDCSRVERGTAGDRDKSDKSLRCAASEAGQRKFKVGTSGHERSVTVTTNSRGTLIDLARVETSE